MWGDFRFVLHFEVGAVGGPTINGQSIENQHEGHKQGTLLGAVSFASYSFLNHVHSGNYMFLWQNRLSEPRERDAVQFSMPASQNNGNG